MLSCSISPIWIEKAASGPPSILSRPSERAGRGFEPEAVIGGKPAPGFEIDKLVSGPGRQSHAHFLFAKPVSTFAECAPSTYRTCRHAAGPLSQFLRGGR